MGEFGEPVAIAFVEAMGVETRAAGCYAKNGEAMSPRPCLNVLAEAEAYLAIAMGVFHDKSADQGVPRRLKMMLDGDFDPADDLLADAGDEGGLIVRT